MLYRRRRITLQGKIKLPVRVVWGRRRRGCGRCHFVWFTESRGLRKFKRTTEEARPLVSIVCRETCLDAGHLRQRLVSLLAMRG